MFGGSKPSFGTTPTASSFGGFSGTTAATPFGQSAFGKPAAPAFGNTSTFAAQPAQQSLFGAAATPAQPAGGLFGANTSTAFGSTATAQPTAFGAFSQPQQTSNIFGSTQTPASTSLFGSSTLNAFAPPNAKPTMTAFGQTAAAQPTSSLFGQPAAATSTAGFGSFGTTAPTTTSVFGSGTASAFAHPQATAVGATGVNTGTAVVKYQPTLGTDTLMKSGQPNNVNTKQHCITAMKEYEGKSLEELRLEDYMCGRKGPQAGSAPGAFGFGAQVAQPAQPAAGGLFGSTTQPSTGLFGQAVTENKSMFGSTAFGQQSVATNAFAATGQQNNFLQKPFGATTATPFAAPAADASNPFGAKPAFGQTGSLFGQAPATSAAPAFGQTNTGFGGFGSTAGATTQTSLFGTTPATDPNKSAFGLGTAAPAANTGFGFGAPATSTAGGGLFGSKPATSFAAPAFGATSTASAPFSGFGMSASTPATGGGLFNSGLNKPATSGFGGFGATTAAPLNFNAGNTGGSLFGNAQKPGGSLFGGATTTLGGTGAAPTGGLFGGNTGGFGGVGGSLGGGFGGVGANNSLTGGLMGAQPTMGIMTPSYQPIHQQILARVTSPYGDSPIFKDLKHSDEADATRATNPAAQQAVLDMSNNQYKIATKDSLAPVKVKALGSTLNRKSLFDGLEEFDATVEGFNLKPNAKRLVIKPKVKNVESGNPSNSIGSRPSTPQSHPKVATPSKERESFGGAIPSEPLPPAGNSPGAPKGRDSRDSQDISRRESWLHPNNLEKVRQHNIQTGMDQGSPHNSTVNELVPRKPLDTYRPSSTVRLSVSTIPENPFEDQSSTIARRDTFTSDQANDSVLSSRSHEAEDSTANRSRLAIEAAAAEPADYEAHPTGIVLRRVGYYTIPSLDDLRSYLAEDGSCVVPNFTVGREGYGNVFFGKEMDVAGLNLDEIVHFRNKEVIIYPDDDNKPSIGNGLNRDAQVTLDQVWPLDKTKHEAIKEPQRLLEMDWEGKLRRVCDKNDTRFIEYRPETGSWVFRVKHFSKYGLGDSDEEDDVPTDPKKAKMAALEAQQRATAEKMTLTSLRQAQKISEDAARNLDPKSLVAGVASGFRPMDDTAEFMLMDKTQFFQAGANSDFSMFDAPRHRPTITSPTAALAQHMVGNETHKMQLMKSSLFVDDNASEDEPMERHLRHRTSFNVDLNAWKDGASECSSQYDFGHPSPALPVSSSVSEASLLCDANYEGTSSMATGSIVAPLKDNKTESTVVKAFKFVCKPKVAAVKVHATTVPLPRSIAHEMRHKWIADLGFYKGRSFKLSFGPHNSLVLPNTFNNMLNLKEFTGPSLPASMVFAPRSATDMSHNVMQLVQFHMVKGNEGILESIVPHLEVQLSDCISVEVEGSECPWIQPESGTTLVSKHFSESLKQRNAGLKEEYAVSVWSLLFALWGDHDELVDLEKNSHYTVMCRRNLLSEWLENTLMAKDLLSKKVSSYSYLEHMLELLSCHRVNEACELAFNYDDANLALVLAQLSSGAVFRLLMEEQLYAWQQSKSDKYIDLERLKMYMLAAGVPMMQSSQGAINLLEDNNWLTVLAMQLWYFTAPTSTITDALNAYNKAFQAEECYAEPPKPSYKDAPTETKKPVYDLRYHLLQLYSKRTHSLEETLNPITHTADPMDFRLSWLLLQTLRALGYRHCSPLTEARLSVDFASQLENEGLWHWSIFVLLHIKRRPQRERAVQQMLERNVSVSAKVPLNAEERFVVEELGIPMSWVDYAKAVKAGASGMRHLQAKYLLKAKHFAPAHEVIFQYIAPHAIINGKLDYLHNLLIQFEDTEGSSIRVPNWANQGQIFLDFIDISAKFNQIRNVTNIADINARWENLKPQLSELCSRIGLLPCPTSKHRLCQSEISQSLSCLVRGLCIVCPEMETSSVLKVALERLPLPQEFSSKELRIWLEELLEKIENEPPRSQQEQQQKQQQQPTLMET
ncbi:LOW QUALITY PROTEIN: nuclear pore complex protein Nup98-Nup96 [Drosophila gunungcola]|uniref:LOW QUALITY PROTEIN: nuclear pore complex protein Nup98-Nup96 n=1 Tax=Drosophila gunungcola TaxID=103775 RepID=UPI0022E627D1|nr:LOW QUALITY PROTEIN: nuclear pore complex protein Nup98-Nup96 [Drosophila gunungcola]